MLRIETLAPPAQDKKHLELKKATQQFEGYFLQELLKEMRKTVPQDKLLGDDGHGQEIFRDMMDQKLSENMSSRGDLGMAQMMYDQLAPSLGEDLGDFLKNDLGDTTDTVSAVEQKAQPL